MDFEWRVGFTLRNVVIEQPFSFDGIGLDQHPKSSKDEPKVRVTYRFTTTSGYPAEKVAGEALERMERFLACANVNLALTGWDVREPMEEFDVELENWQELRNAGITPPTKFSMQMHNTSTYRRDFVQTAWEWAEKLQKLPDAEVIMRILRLLRQSMLENDEYDRLSKVWRSFNALYNHRATNSRAPETERIKEFAHGLSAAASYQKGWLANIMKEYWTAVSLPAELKDQLMYVLVRRKWASVMDCLIKHNFVGRDGTNHSSNLATAVGSQNIIDSLESALLCVYVERNRVMHGEILSEDENDLLYVCALFLQRIVAVALNEFYFVPITQSQS